MGPHDFHLKAIASGDVDFILTFNNYNLIRQTIAKTILPAATQADVGVMNGWSILRGLLTGIDLDTAAAKERWKNSPDLEPARARWKWCMEKGIDMLQLAIQFCLRDERIHGNNIGSLNLEQLESNVRAASTPLSDEVWEEYDARFGNKVAT
jgi:aryl-alcohol dehydrogenase-like predicted oxidoreductase